MSTPNPFGASSGAASFGATPAAQPAQSAPAAAATAVQETPPAQAPAPTPEPAAPTEAPATSAAPAEAKPETSSEPAAEAPKEAVEEKKPASKPRRKAKAKTTPAKEESDSGSDLDAAFATIITAAENALGTVSPTTSPIEAYKVLEHVRTVLSAESLTKLTALADTAGAKQEVYGSMLASLADLDDKGNGSFGDITFKDGKVVL